MSRAETFFSKANKKYGNKYDYSLANYKGYKEKMVIVCPVHGEFEQSARLHLEGKYGCKKCQVDSQRKSKKAFIEDAIRVHGSTYSYSKVAYVNDSTPVTIVCKKHGEFKQSPGNHTGTKKAGCRKCADDRTRERCRKPQKVFEQQVKDVTTSDFDVVGKYVNDSTPVKVKCLKCSTSSYVIPSNILHGQGCGSCAEYGFKPNKSAFLYFFKIKNCEVYKIGITNNDLTSRYNSTDRKLIENKIYVEFGKGKDARKIEKYLLNKYSDYKYVGPPILSSGNTELVTIDLTKEIIECQKIYHL